MNKRYLILSVVIVFLSIIALLTFLWSKKQLQLIEEDNISYESVDNASEQFIEDPDVIYDEVGGNLQKNLDDILDESSLEMLYTDIDEYGFSGILLDE